MPATLTRGDGSLILDLSTTGRGSEFNDILRKIKDVPGARFDWDDKLWFVPDEPANADRILKTIRPKAQESLLEWLRAAHVRQAEEVTTPLPDDGTVQVPWGTKRMAWQPTQVNDLKFTGLFDYQRAAVAHIARARRAILADDMGLGKTLQAISIVEEFRLRNRLDDGTLLSGPKLIISPKSVLGGWLRELNRWLEPDTFGVQVIDGYSAEKRHKQLLGAIRDDLWIIANWEALRSEHQIVEVKHRSGLVSKEKRPILKEPLYEVPWAAHMDLSLDDLEPRLVARLKAKADKVQVGKWLAVVADEIHRAKNPQAKQTKGLYKVRAEEGIMLGLTGTPVMNSPGELWSLLHWLWPEQFTSHDRFETQFVESYEQDTGNGFKTTIVTGVKNPDALRFQIRGRVIRRTAGSVRSLPGHRRIFFPVEMHAAQKKAYKDAEREMWLKILADIDAGSNEAKEVAQALLAEDIAAIHRIPNGGARTVRLRQIIENLALLGGPDVSANMDAFEDRFDDSRPEPWVVGVEFRDSATILADRLRKRHKADVGVYTGNESSIERTRTEDSFQAGNLDAIVGTIGALKEGITLTRTNRGFMLSEAWVPAVNEQFQARYANRTGQARKATTFIPQAIGTVASNKVRPTNELKDKIVRAVHDKDTIEEVHHG